VPEWLKGADCKSAGECLQRFKSSPLHHFYIHIYTLLIIINAGIYRYVREINQADYTSSPIDMPLFARVAQMVEHFLGKEKVIGSSPIAGSTL
jgi:hypothetical protein